MTTHEFTPSDIYDHLNQLYDIQYTHSISRGLFMDNPSQCERWIHIYFSNPALINRPNGCCILLRVFLACGPDAIMSALLQMDLQAAESRPEFAPLLRKQRLAVQAMVIRFFHAAGTKDHAPGDWIQDQQDQCLGGANMTGIHDNRYIQPMKHFEPTAKWKSRGGVNL